MPVSGQGIPDQPQMSMSMAPSFLQQARYGQAFDPQSMAMARIAAGANPDIVREAFESMYGRPFQMAGVG